MRIADFIEHAAHQADVMIFMRSNARQNHPLVRRDTKIKAMPSFFRKFLQEDSLRARSRPCRRTA